MTTVADIERELARERAAFMAAFERVPLAQREIAPAHGGWSAVQVAEHVMRVEAGVAKMIGAAATMPRTATAEELAAAQLTAEKSGWVRDRRTKVNAPERVHPQAALTAASVMEQLRRSREALLAAYHSADDAVLDGVAMPHPFLGPLTMRAWVALIADHDARHAEQLQELAPQSGD